MGVDALAQTDWGTVNNFVNTPFHLIPQIFTNIQADQAETPCWQNPASPGGEGRKGGTVHIAHVVSIGGTTVTPCWENPASPGGEGRKCT